MRLATDMIVAALGLTVSLAGCATTMTTLSVNKPGFHTEIRDGRLWVFREGSQALEDFKKQGSPRIKSRGSVRARTA